jgi:hypothetical protein
MGIRIFSICKTREKKSNIFTKMRTEAYKHNQHEIMLRIVFTVLKILNWIYKVVIPKLVFTVLFLEILHWIYEVVIHSRVFILYLPANIDF